MDRRDTNIVLGKLPADFAHVNKDAYAFVIENAFAVLDYYRKI